MELNEATRVYLPKSIQWSKDDAQYHLDPEAPHWIATDERGTQLLQWLEEELPFGGVGPSGTGSYHGEQGFRTFSHAKSIYRQAKLNVGKLAGMLPPYGKATESTIKMQLKK